jgi:LuxR family transcriptional regulator, maltose regulon positive regulatory protein
MAVFYNDPMSTPILATKLYVPPPRLGVVPRSRLVERLDMGLHHKLTLISAPAGFGKTTLAGEWLAGRAHLDPKVRVAWLSLDEGDSEPARFLSYLIASLQTVVAGIGEGVLSTLESPQPPPTESVLTALLNEVATVPGSLVLVLDDYHVVDAIPVDEALAFMLEHLPAQMHLVIATREDPGLPLARLRARSQLTELRAADLRFTPAEAAEFLNQAMSLSLSAADISAVETRTEGWIAGLQMAALALQGMARRGTGSTGSRSDTAGFIQAFTGSHRFVMDYLVEEVLQRQPENVRSFLLQTSILHRLCGPLCDAVTGQKDGGRTLEGLERENLFLVPLDDRRQWYRYHHLFAEVLQVRLLVEQPEQLPALHGRASRWYEENGSPSDAIRHSLLAKDFGRAADLVELAGPMVEQGSQSAIWLNWVRELPDELIRARPVLSVWHAYALLGSGELEAAEARLVDAERWLDPADHSRGMVAVDDEQLRVLLATIAVARAYHAHSLGDVPGTVRHAQRVLELLPEGEHVRRQQATALMGMTYWANGDLEAADRVFTDYVMRLLAAANIPDAISAATVLTDVKPALGRLHEAVGALEQLLQFVVDRGERLPPDAADLYLGLGELDLERGDPVAAAEHLLRSKELGEQAELPVWRYRWCVAQARLTKTQGDPEGALRLLDEAERLFVRTPLPDIRPISALKARIWAARGRVTEAMKWARERGLSVDDDLSYLREFEHVTLARVLIAQYESGHVDPSGALNDAARLLERLLRAAEEGGRIGSEIEILALQALAHQVQGNTSLALAPLERALSLAGSEGYVRVFVDEGPPMARLLQEVASRAIAPDGAKRLLAAFPSAMPGDAHPAEARCEGKEPLSTREIEVLQHIAAGRTNREIAARLYLSLYTVKAHARSIYHKLDAHSRTQAVVRARELGILLDPEGAGPR